MLRDRIQESIVDEARNLVSRAETVVGSRSGHPLSKEIRQQVGDLNKLIERGDKEALEDKMDDLLRLLTELEAAR